MAPPTATTSVPGAASLEDRLAAFFAEHYGRMTRLAGLICHSGSNTEDAVQAAMEQAWRRRGSLRDASRMRWWIDRIVVREAIRQNRRPWWAGVAEPLAGENAPLRPDPAVHATPERLALAAALGSLPIEQRAACVLHLYAGYSVPETAELMGTSFETARSRLRLARRRLRAELSEREP